MIISDTIEDKAISNVKGEAKTFGMQASAKAFQILSSKLYSDPIKSIVREISCNAIDACRAADNPGKWIIHPPTTLEPEFYVQDFGIGLGPDEVLPLYTYFESTKATSNDDNGAFGLGSKSPFAYTPSFTVETVKDGIRAIYFIFTSDEGLPSYTKMMEAETNAHNGVKISFGVREKDFREFNSKIIEFVALLPEDQRPQNFKDLVPEFEEGTKYFDDALTVISTKSVYGNGPRWYNTPTYVRVGSATYDLSKFIGQNQTSYTLTIAEAELLTKFRRITVNESYGGSNRNFIIVLETPIGSVDIAPTREDLIYSPRTNERLIKILKNIQDKVAHEHITQLQKMSDDELQLEYNSLKIFHRSRVNIPAQQLISVDAEFEYFIKSKGHSIDDYEVAIKARQQELLQHRANSSPSNPSYNFYKVGSLWHATKYKPAKVDSYIMVGAPIKIILNDIGALKEVPWKKVYAINHDHRLEHRENAMADATKRQPESEYVFIANLTSKSVESRYKFIRQFETLCPGYKVELASKVFGVQPKARVHNPSVIRRSVAVRVFSDVRQTPGRIYDTFCRDLESTTRDISQFKYYLKVSDNSTFHVGSHKITTWQMASLLLFSGLVSHRLSSVAVIRDTYDGAELKKMTNVANLLIPAWQRIIDGLHDVSIAMATDQSSIPYQSFIKKILNNETKVQNEFLANSPQKDLTQKIIDNLTTIDNEYQSLIDMINCSPILRNMIEARVKKIQPLNVIAAQEEVQLMSFYVEMLAKQSNIDGQYSSNIGFGPKTTERLEEAIMDSFWEQVREYGIDALTQ